MVRILSFLLTPLEMSVFIGRLLLLFYIIAIPVFLGLYVTSMVSAHPKLDALWMEGGVTQYGPAAFWVLLSIFVFPACVSFFHYLLSDAQSCLKNVLSGGRTRGQAVTR
jgi:uncharacterized metal-binding protein